MGFLSSGFRRPKQYEYQPLYYDQAKEDREKRRNRARMRGKINDAEMPEYEEKDDMFKPTFKSKFKDYKNVGSGSWDNFSRIRRIIVLVSIGLVIAIIYLVLQLSNYLANNV